MISVLADRVGLRPERQYLCRRCESEGHLSGGRVGITAHVSQRRDRATKEKPCCHHVYHEEATRPLQHCDALASASLSTRAVKSDCARLIGQGHGQPFPSGLARTVGLMGPVVFFFFFLKRMWTETYDWDVEDIIYSYKYRGVLHRLNCVFA